MRHVAYCGSRGIYDDMVASAKSLVAHTEVDAIWFFAEDAEFPCELPDYVHVVDVSEQEWFDPDGPNMTSGYTYLAMMRAVLCRLLPDADRVLSLDADTVCVGDVSGLWDIDLDGKYFAAAREPHRCYCDVLYTNTGVCMYNLGMLRDGKADEVVSVLNGSKFQYLEQDAFNCLCQGRIAEMGGDYNANDWTEHSRPRILHFAGHSDWRDRPEVAFWRNATWEQAEAMRGRSTRVLVAVPMYDKADPACFKAIYDMGKPCPCDFDYVRGYGAAKARNDIARRSLDGGYTHVMMVDSDVVVPPDALELMLEGDADVVFGCYPRKATSTGQSELFTDGEDFTDSNNVPYSRIDAEPGRFDVKGGGMGCVLIRTDVFGRIPFPWFSYVEYQDGNVLSEDLRFCEQAEGLSMQADSRVRCGHIGSTVQYR